MQIPGTSPGGISGGRAEQSQGTFRVRIKIGISALWEKQLRLLLSWSILGMEI